MQLRIIFLTFIAAIAIKVLPQQPNILWITIEDTSPQFIGAYGNKQAKTPTIDKLAREGVRFDNAFSNGTVCSPSRSAIITGVRTNVMGTGNHRSYYKIPDFIKGFPYYMREKGYYTSNNSKTDYNTANAKQIIKNSWDESSGKAGWWKREPGQPFFAVFNIFESHQSRTMTNPWDVYTKQILNHLEPDELVDEKQIEVPPFLRNTPEVKHQLSRIYNCLSLTDKKTKAILDRLESDGLMDSTIIFFFADHGEGMPRGKTNGINLGYRVPFVIWFPEMHKHLSPWGTQIASDENISFIDLAPTLLSITGATIPEYMNGRPILGEKRQDPVKYLFMNNDGADNSANLSRTVTDGRYIYTKVFMPYIPENRWIKYFDFSEIEHLMLQYEYEGTNNDIQSQTFKQRQFEYLYDIKNDLWETNNLAYKPEYKKIAKQMSKALDKKLLEINDVLFCPELEIKERISQTGTTPYNFRNSKDEYNFQKIYKTALLTEKETNLKQQVKLLNSPDSLIRYWASVGIRSHSNPIEYKDQIAKHIKDNSDLVAINIACVCLDKFNMNSAKDILLGFLDSENPAVTTQCLHSLHYIQKDKSKDFIPKATQIFEETKDKRKLEALSNSAETFLYMHQKLDLHYDKFW